MHVAQNATGLLIKTHKILERMYYAVWWAISIQHDNLYDNTIRYSFIMVGLTKVFSHLFTLIIDLSLNVAL